VVFEGKGKDEEREKGDKSRVSQMVGDEGGEDEDSTMLVMTFANWKLRRRTTAKSGWPKLPPECT
jgi:hypothetical protein